MKLKIKYFFLAFLFLLSASSFAQTHQQRKNKQETPVTRILFVFDASQSMYARWQSNTKITIARKLLSNLLDSLRNVENLELALRVYGHQYLYPPQVCNDTKLEVPFAPNNIDRIKHRLKSIKPRGTTPIAFALEKSGGDFTPRPNCRNIIVLITDGIEECDGDPCAVSNDLQKRGIVLKPFIIGIGKNFKDVFDCVGTYFDASSEEQFSNALEVVISQALNSTSCQINLLDESKKPTETNVNMTFYDDFSGLEKHNFMHTMNSKGLPDTLVIDPLLTYNIVVHTIPPVFANNVKLNPGKHTIIPISAPQGFLQLKIDGKLNSLKDLQCIIRKHNDAKTLNVQGFVNKEKYICGRYDLEILCLPRIYINDVEISQSKTTNVEIPMPGIAVIKKTTKGYGSLYHISDNKLNWLYNFKSSNPYQENLILQPGTYKVVFRSKYSDRSFYTIKKTFTVTSGKTTNLKLFSN